MIRRLWAVAVKREEVGIFVKQGFSNLLRAVEKGHAEADCLLTIVSKTSGNPQPRPSELGRVTEREAIHRLAQNFIGIQRQRSVHWKCPAKCRRRHDCGLAHL